MKVDVEGLVRECIRWGAQTNPQYTREMAHNLLEKLPRDQRVHILLEHAAGKEWQLVFASKHVTCGSFEDCVTTLARMSTP